MATILCIETATPVCSIALIRDGSVLHLEETAISQSHASSLMEFINHSLDAGGVSIKDLDAVAISKGPGSYTGLRIGVSTAKGLCFALNKPLIGTGTLNCMAMGMKKFIRNEELPVLLCPMIDARRMEVYTALFDLNMNEVAPVTASIIDESSFSELLSSNIIYFAGNGAEKCREFLEINPNAKFPGNEVVSAANMAQITLESYNNNLFEDVAYFEPFYLKDFIPGKSRVKGLH
jgi:tRNA threonylcarbamoyladenosine biosynthesis protein TsaB